MCVWILACVLPVVWYSRAHTDHQIWTEFNWEVSAPPHCDSTEHTNLCHSLDCNLDCCLTTAYVKWLAKSTCTHSPSRVWEGLILNLGLSLLAPVQSTLVSSARWLKVHLKYFACCDYFCFALLHCYKKSLHSICCNWLQIWFGLAPKDMFILKSSQSRSKFFFV